MYNCLFFTVIRVFIKQCTVKNEGTLVYVPLHTASKVKLQNCITVAEEATQHTCLQFQGGHYFGHLCFSIF